MNVEFLRQPTSHLLIISNDFWVFFYFGLSYSYSKWVQMSHLYWIVATYMDYLLDKGQETKPQNCVWLEK